jgi:hypothetical protein
MTVNVATTIRTKIKSPAMFSRAEKAVIEAGHPDEIVMPARISRRV